MKYIRAVLLLASCLNLRAFPACAEGSVMITEIMGSNRVTALDEGGDSPGWIEIYNGTEKKINLKGYGLSDKPKDSGGWILPERYISPGEYMIVYASGKNKAGRSGPLHTNFKLSERDKGVYLFDSHGTLISHAVIDKLPRDISYGLNPATGRWEYYPSSTPGKANTTAALSPIVKYSVEGGFYPSPISVRLYTEEGEAAIYYTTDGSTPSLASKVYSGPVEIERNTTIRAFSLIKEHLEGPPSGQTYFIDFDNLGMAVVAIATEEEKLWDPANGLFRSIDYRDNMLRDKVRVHVSFFDEKRTLGFSQDATMAVVGAGSREIMMRPLKLNATNEIDPMNGKFKCRLFPKNIEGYRHLELRNNNQDGVRYASDPDSTPTMGLRNALFCEILKDQAGIETRYDNGPVLLFINGKNYGMMNLGEKRDDSGIHENNPTVKSKDVDMVVLRDDMGMRMGRAKLGEGLASIRNDGKIVYKGYFMDGAVEYEQVSESARRSGCTKAVDEFISMDPTDAGKVDPRSFIAAMAAEVIACNTDFGMNNLAFWRSSPLGKTPGPFHTYLFDFDSLCGLAKGYEDYNIMLDYNEKSKLFSQFVKKEEYKTAFIRKIDELLNGPFRPENVIPIIEKLEKRMEPWIEYHLDMWAKGQIDKKRWQENVAYLKRYVSVRPKYVRLHVKDLFDVPGYSDMTFPVAPEGKGSIFMDTGIFNTDLDGRGTYAKIPMKICAKPLAGYKFSHFEVNGSVVKEQVYTFTPEDGMRVQAFFVEDATAPAADIVIDKVAWSGKEKIKDEDGKKERWIEIHNTTKHSIDLAGMYLTDSEEDLTRWRFPDVSIGADKFMVIFLSGKNRTEPSGKLHTNFKLSSSEPILIVDKDGKTVVHKVMAQQTYKEK